MSEHRLLTTDQAAERLAVHSQTLRQWIREGHGPVHIRMSANRIRFRSEDIDAYIDAHVVPG